MTREEQMARWKQLTEVLLPERARREHWPVRLDHCFKRICLDDAFGDVWYGHLRRPAERHIAGEALQRTLGCAEALLIGDRALLDRKNEASLRYRGKLKRSSPGRNDTPDATPVRAGRLT